MQKLNSQIVISELQEQNSIFREEFLELKELARFKESRKLLGISTCSQMNRGSYTRKLWTIQLKACPEKLMHHMKMIATAGFTLVL